MTQHFAASWLQSLEKKLDALDEWTWAADQSGECTMHRNLFRECFNPKFQKTLALVDSAKRTAFLNRIEQNLYKFDARSQQFPLACLSSMLLHGKESSKTQDKIGAWVDSLLAKLRNSFGSEAVTEVVEECLSPPFQKFAPLMEGKVMDRLCDGLGEHLVKCDEDTQKKVIDAFSAVPARIEKVMRTCTQELNEWLETAPRFPSTPLMLSDTLSKMQHPLLRFFNRIKDANVKESFLVSVALALQGLRTRFRWMRTIEPELDTMGSDIQGRLFFVEGQGAVMEMWLSSRLKKYNSQVTTKAAQLLGADPGKAQMLKARLEPLFPKRNAADPNSGWLTLDGPSNLADALLGFLVESDSSFFVPQHTMALETVLGVLQRFGSAFEIDAQRSRVRVDLPPPPPGAPTLPGQPPVMVPPPLPPRQDGAPGRPPVMVPPASAPPLSSVFETPDSSQVPIITLPGESAKAGDSAHEPNNLVDLLLHEALEPVAPEVRSKICKLAPGVYRFGEKEVTLHTQTGRLFVYRVGMMVRNCPLKTLLQEEGLIAAPEPPAGPPPLSLLAQAAAPAISMGAVDSSSVAKIAAASAQISAGVLLTNPSAQPQTSNPFTQKSDPQVLMSKRVEAATRAMDVSKQIVRRSVNFDDEKFLRKLLAKGLKHDRAFNEAYETFCSSRGIADLDSKKQDRNFVATFLERNLASSINSDWAQKVIHGGGDDEDNAKAQRKKEKKLQKKQDKKDKKKRKASGSESSSDERQTEAPHSMQPPSSQPPVMQPPTSHPPVMQPPNMPPPPMGMPMFPGMPPMGMPGMMGQMGMGGMAPHFSPGMIGDGMPPMGMNAFEDPGSPRLGKKAKGEKDKHKKDKKR